MKKLLLLITGLLLLFSVEGQILRYSNYTAPVTEDNNELLTGLQGYWSFEELSGTIIYDSTPNNNDGAFVNTPTINQTGKIGKCYSFAKASDQKTRHGGGIGDFGTNDCTVSAWVNLSSLITTEPHSIMGKYTGSAPQWYLRVDNNEKVSLYWRSSGEAIYAVSSSALSTGTWYHVVCTMDRSGYATIYINGSADGTPLDISAYVSDNMDNTLDFVLGGRIYNGDTFSMDGLLDEVGIWYRVLTPAEITYLYNSGNGVGYEVFK